MNDNWRRSLWFLGILSSLVVVFVVITAYYSGPSDITGYAKEFLQKIIYPIVMSFITVCIAGLLYEIFLRDHDRAGLSNTIYRAVRGAIYGSNAMKEIESDERRQNNLDFSQIVVKNKLIDLANEDHEERLQQFSRKHILRIPEFKDSWEILIRNTFINDGDMLDFSIGSNAMIQVQAYQFANYYSNLILERGRHKSSSSRIRIMVFCNDVGPRYGDGKDMTVVASKELETAIARILRKAAAVNKLPPTLSASETFRMLATQSEKIYQLRLINEKHFHNRHHENDAFDVPFNVYGKIALSRSYVAPSHLESVAPMPHLEVSLKQADIDAYRLHFSSLWDEAACTIDAFADTLTDWSVLGEGKLLATWSSIELPK